MEHATSEQLMAEMGWVRQLARALVKNRDVADDVAQDAWLVATEQRPAEDRPLRPWLARVVVNLVRTRRRGEARREQRGAAFDADRAVPTPRELVERVELQRAVADEVLALDEPYRSTVLLHFVEGYSSADIARRLGIPDGTVRRRLKVALDQLREALRKRTDQPRRGWLAALAPFAGLPEPNPVPSAIGVIAMTKVIGVGLLLLLLIGLGVLWRRGAHRDDEAAAGSTSRAHSEPFAAPGDRPDEAKLPIWISQAGAPARRIAGRVMARGTPIGGATVRLGFEVTYEPAAAPLPPIPLLQPIAEVTSAPDGTFDFGVQPPAAFTVSATAASYTATSVGVANADPRAKPDRLELELGACQSRLSGVIGDSGGGIAKARILVAGLSGTESDANGKYSVCLYGQTTFGSPTARVRIEAEHYGTINHTVIVVGDLHQDFAMVPEAVFAGRVTTADGHAVAGARVVADVDGSELPHHVASGWTTTTDDGEFRIASLAPGAFHLSATADGLGMTLPVAAIARPAATSHEIRLVLVPLARLAGRVVANGAPVAGVTVAAGQPGSTMATRACTSQADGSFVLDRVPYGTIAFFAKPYEVRAPAQLQITRASVDDLTLDVARMPTVRGHVTRKGQPVAGAHVVPTASINPYAATITDATGAYAIEGLPPGPLRVVAVDHVGKAFSHWQAVTLAPGEDKTLDLDLESAGEVSGTVVDQTGNAVPGAYVRMDITDGADDMCEATTDALGHFDCAMLVGGEYGATVTPSPGARQGFAPATGERFDPIQVPGDGVVTGVTLAIANERFAIAGTVVDDSGAAMPDVQIEAIGRGTSTMDFPAAISDASGHFEVGNLARGTYDLHAHAADGSDSELTDIATGTRSASIKLARGGAIAGTLTGFSTPPRVTAQSLTPDRLVGGLATVDGATFSKIGLPPGAYLVEAKAGAEVDGQAVEVHAGETVHVALRSHGVGTIQGTVTELATHAAVAGMRCDANLSIGGQMSMSPPDPSQQAVTDAAGHFVVNAPLGRVRIFCFSTSGGLLSAAGTDVDVTSSSAPTVNVFSVQATFDAAPGDAGFRVAPTMLPVTVANVLPNGPAAAAGLVAGDQIVTLDGASLDGVLPDGVIFLIANHRPGTAMTLGIERGGSARTIKISLGVRHP